MMAQPIGQVYQLQYTSAAVFTGDGETKQTPVLRVRFTTHLDTDDYHDLPNRGWSLKNPALGFMSKHGLQPSEFGDSETLDVSQRGIMVPLVSEGDGWHMSKSSLVGAQKSLDNCEWFVSQPSKNTRQQRESGVSVNIGGNQ